MTPEIDDQLTVVPCGCAENQRAQTMTRRGLMAGIGGLGVAAGLARVFGNSATAQYAYAGAGYTGDTVVVLSLRGGFDGLSAVAPVGDPNYAKLRPTIGIPSSRTIKLDSVFGLHPALASLKPLWDKGQLGAVHAVGQTSPTRSHFSAMEEMENAAPGSHLRTGWLDRMIGLTPRDAFSGVSIGSATPPGSMSGVNPKVSIKNLSTFSLSGPSTSADLPRWTSALRAMQDGANPSVLSAAESTLNVLATVDKIRQSGYTPAAGASYPAGDLGAALRDLANLIKSGVGLRAATVDFGDWDMHSGLGKSDEGWMFRQLKELGLAMLAFATDLGAKMADVTLVTMSEFGRRAAENASGGLDHGHGNLSFILGGGVVGAKVYGTWPGLGADSLLDGDLAGTTDYRTILGEMLEKRSKLPVVDVFPGLASNRLGVFKTKG